MSGKKSIHAEKFLETLSWADATKEGLKKVLDEIWLQVCAEDYDDENGVCQATDFEADIQAAFLAYTSRVLGWPESAGLYAFAQLEAESDAELEAEYMPKSAEMAKPGTSGGDEA